MYRLFSMKVALVFVAIYALSIATGTFIENTSSHGVAREYVYDTLWFWTLQGILALFLLVAIFRAKMYQFKKLGLFLFHISFLIILVGAFLSKNYGYKEDLYLTKGMSRNVMLSGDYFMSLHVTKDGETKEYFQDGKDGAFDGVFDLDGREFKIKSGYYLDNAKVEVLRQKWNQGIKRGAMAFEIIRDNIKREKYYLEDLGAIQFDDFELLFNMEPKDKTKPYFKIEANEGKSQHFKSNLLIKSNFGEEYNTSSIHDFSQGILYYMTDEIGILASEATTIGSIVAVPQEEKSKNTNTVMLANVEYDDMKIEIVLIQKDKYFSGYKKEIWLDENTKVDIRWGKKITTLPFEVYLHDFEVKRYPGSRNVENYFSDIEIIDGSKNIKAKLSVNEPFTYKGYRFFQTKFENNDSTIFMVNYNPGIFWIYLGYVLLTLGLLLNLFRKVIK
ncbi:cytochrome c biogenesis protein ResB [Candidatus Sulfurimonas baltica]|uniref:Cytochrome c biogenesis protein ResB n=1 Tax=Candidatus Sulfurimonas baltica TaxID=2740404 RepID=A0A7S7LV63_9BACT|nr:cytochrome c biogenesis protein ResB [Candidatus Sulfurimonas baltica]QOY51865.1 cytochrome c biogenesis protein ResB [Candidatus Sulfurimonas baltica]